MYKLKYFAQLV